MILLPLRLLPQAKNVKPNIVFEIFKITPNVVKRLTISLAIE